jgi:short-subunit dehydrogenase
MKVTLITGASGGIGEAIAKQIAAQKENLLLVARNEAKLQLLCKSLSEEYKIRVDFIAADLYDKAAPEMIYNTCKARDYQVDSLINNAGIGSGGEFEEVDLPSQLNMMQLNTGALVSLTHYFLHDMKARKSGTIVNLGSMISFMPVPYMAVYGATKTFVRFFTQALYEECKPYGVHVMLFSPGLTESNFMQAANLENDKGQALTAGAKTQTVEQVAAEFIKAYTKKQPTAVSGGFNRFLVKVLGLIPNSFVAKQTASSYQKKMTSKP